MSSVTTAPAIIIVVSSHLSLLSPSSLHARLLRSSVESRGSTNNKEKSPLVVLPTAACRRRHLESIEASSSSPYRPIQRTTATKRPPPSLGSDVHRRRSLPRFVAQQPRQPELPPLSSHSESPPPWDPTSSSGVCITIETAFVFLSPPDSLYRSRLGNNLHGPPPFSGSFSAAWIQVTMALHAVKAISNPGAVGHRALVELQQSKAAAMTSPVSSRRWMNSSSPKSALPPSPSIFLANFVDKKTQLQMSPASELLFFTNHHRCLCDSSSTTLSPRS